MNNFITLFFIIVFSPIWAFSQKKVTPEQFGALGNGVNDDTKSLQRAFDTGEEVILNNTYKVTASLFLKSSIKGNGEIRFDRDYISLIVNGHDLSIQNISFDYLRHTGKMIRLIGSDNISFDNCKFKNVGSLMDKQSTGMLVITRKCRNIHISKCVFSHCWTSAKHASSGVWIEFSDQENRCKQIYIDSCRFEDFQPYTNADAIKVLAQNYDVYLYVSNCFFYKCEKRALKFQARQCFSHNNKIYVSRPMYCAIDFQRGHGSSVNDTIVLDYDGISYFNPNSGLLYRGVCIAQGYVNISNLNIKCLNGIVNMHQAAIGLQSFPDYDDGIIRNVNIKESSFGGVASLLKLSHKVNSVERMIMSKCLFEGYKGAKELVLGRANLKKCNLQYEVSGDSKIGDYVVNIQKSSSLKVRRSKYGRKIK